jgi:hypothetical protein
MLPVKQTGTDEGEPGRSTGGLDVESLRYAHRGKKFIWELKREQQICGYEQSLFVLTAE